jgi:hypothetical protein
MNALEQISETKQRIIDVVRAPSFIRWTNQISFVLGIAFMLGTEYMLLVSPQLLPPFYSVLVTVLCTLRYFSYHRKKYHMFLLDFCYFVNFLLVYYFYMFPHKTLFHALFVITNGPIAGAIILWKNALVFHDWDKVTSMVVHMWPALVTYCVRWYPPLNSPVEQDGASLVLPFSAYITNPVIIYSYWQVGYLFKTMLLDYKKLKNDKNIMTSLRWLTKRSPHPLYKYVKRNGYKIRGGTLVVGTQFLYTYVMIYLASFLYSNKTAHCLWLGFVFLWAIWSGSTYYFQVFARVYMQRLENVKNKSTAPGTYSTSLASIAGFVAFFVAFLGTGYPILQWICL